MIKFTSILILIVLAITSTTVNRHIYAAKSENSFVQQAYLQRTDNASSHIRESELSDLIVLDKLFNRQIEFTDYKGTSLGDLLVLNAIFNEHDISSKDNRYSINDLFVLDALFDQSQSPMFDKGYSSLGDLLILKQIFEKD